MSKDLMSVKVKDKALLGLDIGNGYVKVVLSYNGEVERFVMPSGFVYESKAGFEELGISEVVKNQYHLVNDNNPNPTVLLWDKEIGKNIYFESLLGGKERYNTTEFSTFVSMVMHESLARLGVKNKNDVELYIVSGVPSTHKGSKSEEDLKQTFLNAPKIRAKGELFTPRVKLVNILHQPIGTVLNRLFDKNGFSKDDEEHTIATFDIGTYTSDGAVIQKLDVFKVLKEGNFTENTGMSSVYEDIVDHIRVETGSVIPFSNIEKQFDMDDYKISKRKYVKTKFVKEKSIKEKYDIIKNAMNSKWKEQDRFDEIILTGGGAKTFYPLFIEEGYEMILAEDNQMANALGFYKFGLNLYSDVFEKEEVKTK
ncbi:hypothetical protein [Virgibacillus sp. DJP39]|uniref:ParM/StbA family protein n=1 Tax=Virgibacillus sp. DJP39 TaxID=3409790 RepID=UPI003BB7BFD4